MFGAPILAAVCIIAARIRPCGARFVTTNPLKTKLAAGKPVFGAFVTIPSYKMVENLALPGKLDFIWLEAEHTEWGSAATQEMVVACENEGVVPVVRIPDALNVETTKKYIGTGAPGIVFPNIGRHDAPGGDAVADAKYAISSIKYPPEGIRRAGAERANGYLAFFAEYVKIANDLTMAVLMVETPEMVEAIEEIVKLPGLDVLHMGPYDLSLRMNVSMDSPELAAAVKRVEEAASAARIPLGSAADSMDAAKEMITRGYQFFTVPGDMQMLQLGVGQFFEPGLFDANVSTATASIAVV